MILLAACGADSSSGPSGRAEITGSYFRSQADGDLWITDHPQISETGGVVSGTSYSVTHHDGELVHQTSPLPVTGTRSGNTVTLSFTSRGQSGQPFAASFTGTIAETAPGGWGTLVATRISGTLLRPGVGTMPASLQRS